ncbi:hypothetical protein F4553_005005 [Allocatelliglobosispora scoriae]|uniref:Acyl-CoA carboxylase subunit epsilon n=1 Tax=Allocatelliglobosispora scoriae TaxID=643052 RepID=A0A841BVW4_9ACTN|nr:acyl-CoA carboxylase subunit epsilon [Allocatelliglobosispora scoriae]MBB5871626.1 hypothetical protein [Allocatelliglobosispora scoriae]
MSDDVITVLRGNPTTDEIAALVGVLVGWAGARTEPAAPTAVSAWWASGLPSASATRGPDAWRVSGLPR